MLLGTAAVTVLSPVQTLPQLEKKKIIKDPTSCHTPLCCTSEKDLQSCSSSWLLLLRLLFSPAAQGPREDALPQEMDFPLKPDTHQRGSKK